MSDLQKYLGRNQRRWMMWGKLTKSGVASAPDLMEDGYITEAAAVKFLRDLKARGIAKPIESETCIRNGRNVTLYQLTGGNYNV